MREVQEFIRNWIAVNEPNYEHSKLEEHNLKFRNDLSVFLSSFPPEIKNCFNVL